MTIAAEPDGRLRACPAAADRRRPRRGGDRQRHLRPVGRLAAVAAPPGHAVRGRRPARRPRHTVDVPASDGAQSRSTPASSSTTRPPIRTSPRCSRTWAWRPQASRHVLRGQPGRRRAGIFGHATCAACSRSAATWSARASGRCCATWCASTARRRRDAERFGLMPLDDYLDQQRLRPRLPRRPPLSRWRRRSGRRPAARIGDYPAAAFVRFCENHGCCSSAGAPAGARCAAAAGAMSSSSTRAARRAAAARPAPAIEVRATAERRLRCAPTAAARPSASTRW